MRRDQLDRQRNRHTESFRSSKRVSGVAFSSSQSFFPKLYRNEWDHDRLIGNRMIKCHILLILDAGFHSTEQDESEIKCHEMYFCVWLCGTSWIQPNPLKSARKWGSSLVNYSFLAAWSPFAAGFDEFPGTADNPARPWVPCKSPWMLGIMFSEPCPPDCSIREASSRRRDKFSFVRDLFSDVRLSTDSCKSVRSFFRLSRLSRAERLFAITLRIFLTSRRLSGSSSNSCKSDSASPEATELPPPPAESAFSAFSSLSWLLWLRFMVSIDFSLFQFTSWSLMVDSAAWYGVVVNFLLWGGTMLFVDSLYRRQCTNTLRSQNDGQARFSWKQIIMMFSNGLSRIR